VPISQPVRVLDAVPTDSTGAPLLSLSADGALLYAPPGSTLTGLVFVARDGTEGQTTDPGPTAYFPKLSRDGREIVTATGDAIWLTDISRGTSTRITTTEQTVGGAMSYGRRLTSGLSICQRGICGP
jgi:hypothetical protein